MPHRFFRLALFFCLSLILLNGCAATPKMIYKPLASLRQAPKNVSVWVEKFEDARPESEKGKLGGVYNGYNMRFGDVHEPEAMIESLKKSLEDELENSGYEKIINDHDLTIDAALESAVCNVGTERKADLKIRFKVRDKGQEVLNSIYSGEGKAGIFNMDMSCTDPLISSVKNVMGKFIKDLDEYIKS